MAEIKPGIYHIVEAGSVNSARLTRHGEDWVTVLPPGAAPEPEQEWAVSHGEDGYTIIAVPSHLRPGSYLSWEGEPDKPEPNQKIVYHVSPIPIFKWRIKIAPGFRFSLHADNSELGIQLGPELIFPPFLKLTDKEQIYWLFEFVRPE